MKIKVLYEDANILAIEKPVGILVHPDKTSKEATLYDILKNNFSKLEVVHRLDRETSGVMLFAKNKKTHEFLKKQFSDRTIKKVYVAIVSGSLRNERGIINKPIGRSPADFRRRLAGRGARGEMREAVTEYKVLKRIPNFTVVEVRPKTGRTHQIRVHMKYLNHPVVGDELYNPNGVCPKDLKRMALHAKSIEFKNLKGEIVKVESKIPKEFERMFRGI